MKIQAIVDGLDPGVDRTILGLATTSRVSSPNARGLFADHRLYMDVGKNLAHFFNYAFFFILQLMPDVKSPSSPSSDGFLTATTSRHK